MQRRTTHRLSGTKKYSSSSLSAKHYRNGNDKSKSIKLSLKPLLYGLIIFLIAIFGIGVFLTPSQRKELVEAEHRLEETVESMIYNQPYPDHGKQEDETRKQNIRNSSKENEKKEKKQERPLQKKELQGKKPSDTSEKDDENDKHQSNRVAVDGATSLREQSTRWVDDEKKLKKKLQVLLDIQAKGNSLGVPVLTRYLGEEIPAFLASPLTSMKEELWKKLVDAKYEEMRKEEEEWQKKMALLMEEERKTKRNMGITTL